MHKLICAWHSECFGANIWGSYSIKNGSVTITGCKETVTNIVIPEKIENCPVTSIDRCAFYDCSSLESIAIPDNITFSEF